MRCAAACRRCRCTRPRPAAASRARACRRSSRRPRLSSPTRAAARPTTTCATRAATTTRRRRGTARSGAGASAPPLLARGKLQPLPHHTPPTPHDPPQVVLGRQLAALEGAEAALPLASGMAAISSTLLHLLGPGAHLLIISATYGGTHDLVTSLLARYGVAASAVAADSGPADWEKLLVPGAGRGAAAAAGGGGSGARGGGRDCVRRTQSGRPGRLRVCKAADARHSVGLTPPALPPPAAPPPRPAPPPAQARPRFSTPRPSPTRCARSWTCAPSPRLRASTAS